MVDIIRLLGPLPEDDRLGTEQNVCGGGGGGGGREIHGQAQKRSRRRSSLSADLACAACAVPLEKPVHNGDASLAFAQWTLKRHLSQQVIEIHSLWVSDQPPC